LSVRGAVVGGGIGVERHIDAAAARAEEETERDDEPPVARRGVANQGECGQQAAEREYGAEIDVAKHAAAREAGGDVAGRGRDEQRAQRVEVATEGDPDRWPSDAQETIGQAETHESESGQEDPMNAPRDLNISG
jgi:hypothetical protein